MATGEKRIDQLTVEATTLADDDFLVAQDLSDAQTVKISVASLRALLAPSLQQAYDAGPAPEITTDTTRGGITITTPEVAPAIVLRADVTGLGIVEGMRLHVGGISSTESLEIGPEPPSSGNGQDLRLWGGTAASGADGGTVSINAGDGATPGDILIGTGTVKQIESGTGTTPWTHSGDLTVVGDLTVDGEIHVPPKAPVVEAGTLRVLADADSGKTIRCTAASTVSVVVPALAQGTTIELVQEGTGQVQLAPDSGVTLRYPSAFAPRTAEQWSSVVVTMLDGSNALVRGDLEAV